MSALPLPGGSTFREGEKENGKSRCHGEVAVAAKLFPPLVLPLQEAEDAPQLLVNAALGAGAALDGRRAAPPAIPTGKSHSRRFSHASRCSGVGLVGVSFIFFFWMLLWKYTLEAEESQRILLDPPPG